MREREKFTRGELDALRDAKEELRMSQTPKGLYSRGAGKRQHRPEKPSPYAVYRIDGKLPPKPDKVPPNCVGVQPWGALPAKPPKAVWT